ncbi:MAG: hypothetical protein ACJ8OJ_05445 [Povalibacter sp.]
MWHSAAQTLFMRAGVSIFMIMAAATESLAVDADGDAAEQEVRAVQAIWLVQNVPFEFRGDTIAYECESFKKKVRAVLIAVGVHSSMIVEARCPPARLAPTVVTRRKSMFAGEIETATISPGLQNSRTSSRISARIALASPAIANEQNIRNATTFDTQEQLVARTKGEELPTPSSIPVFPAIWAPIELSSRSDPWLQAVDCELLRQLSTQVLPRIGVEIPRKLRCPASTASKTTLEVKALLPIR